MCKFVLPLMFCIQNCRMSTTKCKHSLFLYKQKPFILSQIQAYTYKLKPFPNIHFPTLATHTKKLNTYTYIKFHSCSFPIYKF